MTVADFGELLLPRFERTTAHGTTMARITTTATARDVMMQHRRLLGSLGVNFSERMLMATQQPSNQPFCHEQTKRKKKGKKRTDGTTTRRGNTSEKPSI